MAKSGSTAPPLIYDLNTTKGTVGESPLKIHSHSKQCSSKPEKSHLFLEVSKKKKEEKKERKKMKKTKNKTRNSFESP